MLTALTILGAAILGGLWRRWFGGWPECDCGRAPKLAAGFLLGFFAVWPALPWWAALPISGALLALWLKGHKLQEWDLGDWLRRYGPVGVYWWAAQRAGKWMERRKIEWPLKSKNLDGPFALAEMAAGGTMYGAAAWLASLA